MTAPQPRYRKSRRDPVDNLGDSATQADDVDSVDEVDEAGSDRDLDGIDDDQASAEAADQHLLAYEENLADRRASSIAAGRRKGGAAGAAMAGMMLALQDILETPKDDAPVVVESSSKPEDLDSEGITVEVDGTGYHTPPLDRLD